MDKIYFVAKQESTGIILDFESFAIDRIIFSFKKNIYLDKIRLLCLTNDKKWKEILNYNLLISSNNKIVIDFEKTIFNYLKIELSEQTYFQVEIDLFLRNRIIVAGLNSYIGDRFLSILNSMYICKGYFKKNM